MSISDSQASSATAAAPGPVWFAQSERIVDGRPDARYGWWQRPDGVCIVKQLNMELGPSMATLLDHERHVLARLGARGAPVPRLVEADGPAGWLVTRFAGLSLRLLQDQGHLGVQELLSAWVHLLRRVRAFETAGALPVDLYADNVVVPLEQVLSGQPRLQDVLMIDHAHTVVAGRDLRRPVLIGTSMDRIPPELRTALQADQARFMTLLAQARLPMPQTTAALRSGQASAQFWIDYHQEQQVQRLLDSGTLDIGAAIQFAAGVAIRRALVRAGAADWQRRLAGVMARLTADVPAQRYPGLDAAAQALEQAVGAIARVGRQRIERVTPALLASRGPVRPVPAAVPESGRDAHPGTAQPSAQAVPGGGSRHEAPGTQRADGMPAFPWRLAGIATVLGAVTGAGLKLAGIGP